ncbi:MAG TPA: cytochrome c biogenesis protein ResB [Candidatus Methylacidiphilales bacterium]|nr:cytochrome c biogenesis protein ResB [Candidatus Methylacidiphilales bacterium]
MIGFFTSLRLTVVLLALAIILVFIGTLAQVDEGLYNAQARYFRQWLIFGVDAFGYHVPLLLPGGYLIGTMLLLNLVASHVYRFQLTWKKIGIQIIHSGVILLLVGQLVTDMFAHESQIQFSQGETRSYAESARTNELAFVTGSGAGEEVIVIPGGMLASGSIIQDDNLPFTIRVKRYWENSEATFRAPMMKSGPPLAPNGIATSFDFQPAAETKNPDEKNVPTALIELIGPQGSLGDWVVSGWASDKEMLEGMRQNYEQQVGPQMAQTILAQLTRPQVVNAGGKSYILALRPKRVYFPFSLSLLKATHTVYQGTDIPKDFRSRVELRNPQTGEDREVEISMNHPLRYAGLTFYQYQMDAGQAARQAGRTPSSVLQVVHNPGWLTPYVGCGMVAIGLTTQFLFHLIGFLSKRKVK